MRLLPSILLAALSGCDTVHESQASRDRLNCVYTERYEHRMTDKQAEDRCAR